MTIAEFDDLTTTGQQPVSNVSANLPTPDTTLAANWFTALVPTPPIHHVVAYAAESAWLGLKRLFKARTAPAFKELRPPGDVPTKQGGKDIQHIDASKDSSAKKSLVQTSVPKMRSRETRRDLPQLPVSYTRKALAYSFCLGLAMEPSPTDAASVIEHDSNATDKKKTPLQLTKQLCPNIQDAFHSTIEISKGAQGVEKKNLLPDSVRNSSLLNTKTDFEGCKHVNATPGERSVELVNQLADRKTGFVAGITYNPDNRELLIAFPGVGASGMSARQTFRTALNWLGLVPKHLSQASKLSRLVKEHVDALNSELPEEEQIKLTLIGQSMGGGMASYAALRNKVSAVVINPMRLGLAARAKCGQGQLNEAEKYITEIVVQGDWLSDGHLSKLAIPFKLVGIGLEARGPLGNSRRFLIPKYDSPDPHGNIFHPLVKMRVYNRELRSIFSSTLPVLKATSSRAHADMIAGDVRPAVKAAVKMAIEESFAGMYLTDQKREEILDLVDQLSQLVQKFVFPTKGNDGRFEAQGQLNEVFAALGSRLNPYPMFLARLQLDLEKKYITPPPAAASPKAMSIVGN